METRPTPALLLDGEGLDLCLRLMLRRRPGEGAKQILSTVGSYLDPRRHRKLHLVPIRGDLPLRYPCTVGRKPWAERSIADEIKAGGKMVRIPPLGRDERCADEITRTLARLLRQRPECESRVAFEAITLSAHTLFGPMIISPLPASKVGIMRTALKVRLRTYTRPHTRPMRQWSFCRQDWSEKDTC